MLKNITIQNLALIDALSIDWDNGFNVLTGETGAGKSILIDAIGLAIGTRADAALVRTGADRAEVTAEFAINEDSPAHDWLREQMLDDPEEPSQVLVRRIVGAQGRTRAFINGTAATAAQLRELGELLVNLFGQSESQTLLRADVQRDHLDAYGQYGAELSAVTSAHLELARIDAQIDALRTQGERDPAQVDYLRYQLRELEALRLGDDELTQLDQEQRSLANADRLLQDGAQLVELLYDGERSVYDQLAQNLNSVIQLASAYPTLTAATDGLTAAQAQVQEAADTIRDVVERLDAEPGRLQEVEHRLQDIHDLARKHRVNPAELAALTSRLRAELEQVEHAADHLASLDRQRSAAEASYRTAAAALSQARQLAGRTMGEEVTAIVRQLGMPNAQLIVVVATQDNSPARAWGADDIRFDFSANPGQSARPLAKVASGGELSRVSLALSVVGQVRGGAATMIFDEVDAGISGAVAEIVGAMLRRLGGARQVLCVTHLAQVAALGHAHYGITKSVRDGQTYTRVIHLTPPDRVQELARMQGGVEVSKAALEHARELLQRAATR